MIRRALLSVWDKSGLVDLATELAAAGVALIASGGTARALADAGLTVQEITDLTGFPEILGGRVKTLHPHVHGALLARGTDAHLGELAEHGIAPVDLVVCNLYPFTQTVADPSVSELDAIEQIDIGGVTLLRAAAKNAERVTVVCEPAGYPELLERMRAGTLDRGARRRLALAAFQHTAAYDAAIATWLGSRVADDDATLPDTTDTTGTAQARLPASLHLAADRVQTLRYGENPHQQAAWYRWRGASPAFELLQGKALSYNNLVDLSAAWQMPQDLDRPCVAIVKHTNPCGMAVGATAVEAFDRALACDPVSAFGSIIATNREVDEAFVTRVGKLFVEVIVAPSFTAEAQALLAKKKRNCRVVLGRAVSPTRVAPTGVVLRSLPDGVLVQTDDGEAPEASFLGRRRAPTEDFAGWRVATQRGPSAQEAEDLAFAWSVVKHIKSNAVVLCAGGATVGVGAGQTSRVGAVDIAARLAGERARGSVLASDAFFPFADGLEAAAAAGVTAVIQPGGSKRDAEVVAAADRLGLAMFMTGTRHFRH